MGATVITDNGDAEDRDEGRDEGGRCWWLTEDAGRWRCCQWQRVDRQRRGTRWRRVDEDKDDEGDVIDCSCRLWMDGSAKIWNIFSAQWLDRIV